MTQPHEQITARIRAAGADGRTAMVSFLTAGYPTTEGFADNLLRIASVSDVVEIGVPFTDPMADGLTIQRASHEAIAGGVTLGWIFDTLRDLPERPDAALVLMSYLNPLMAMGYDELARRSLESGVAGFIVPDLPVDESEDIDRALAERGLALIQLVTPVTPPDRLARACRASRGFVYAVTVTGITGGEVDAGEALGAYLRRVAEQSDVPVCAGFGVRSREQVEEIGGIVPGVVVGSAVIECLEQGRDPAAFLSGLLGREVTA